MSELTPEARALLKLGRDAGRPTEADRARSVAALRAELGPAFDAEKRPLPQRAATAKSASLFVASGAAAVAVVGAWLFFRARPAPHVAVAPAKIELAAAPSAVNVASPPVESNSPFVAPVPPPLAATTPAATPGIADRSGHLAEEVALLARATAALNRGENTQALSELEQHRRRFPNGVLTQERRAARARALCALGRTTDAEAELERLAQQGASSPDVLRAREACGLDPNP